MDSERWQQVAHLYELVLEREPAERGAFLNQASAGDDELRREVQSLLAHDSAPVLIDRPLLEAAAPMLDDQPDLEPGTQLGPYRIAHLLGAGGMGQVYRATDTRLGRTVALKILPRALASDRRFRARFDREAQAIAALKHPHICTLHDISCQDGVDFLVMEYLEGETLAARLERGPLSLDQAMTYAAQLAEALAAAHRQGIVHRDLKPANIMLTRGGTKLLDFGLAKPTPSLAAGGASPLTATLPEPTAQGTIIGTFQYMAPEQLEGEHADARTDIFAFGAVVYEMLTGKRAFDGKSRASLIGAILHAEPPAMSTVQPLTPPALDRVVRTCLAKDPDDRWQSARDLSRELRSICHDPRDAIVGQKKAGRLGWDGPVLGALAAATGVAVLATGIAIWSTYRPRTAGTAAIHASIALGDGLTALADSTPALSPDGAVLAFVGHTGDKEPWHLYVRRLAQLETIRLDGTEDAKDPFFSADGQVLGFFARGKLYTIPVSGGVVTELADAASSRGGSWAPDGSILFTASQDRGRVVMKVPAKGGTSQPATTLQDNEVTNRWPQVLPGGTAVLYTAHSQTGTYDDANLVVSSLSGTKRQVVHRRGYYGRYLPSGHLAYVRKGTLFVVRFDLERLVVEGSPVPLLNDITSDPTTGIALFAFSDSGALVYLRGPGRASDVTISWIDQGGVERPMRTVPGDYAMLRFSPDGRQLAMDVGASWGDGAIWTYDLVRETMSRVTRGGGEDAGPVWSPDGKRIAFAGQHDGAVVDNLYWQRADGTGRAERLAASDVTQLPISWHPSGKLLAFQTSRDPFTPGDIGILPVDGDETKGWTFGQPSLILSEPFVEGLPAFSPDGRWLAYTSLESGRPEVYVRPFPGLNSRTQVSRDGGGFPMWSQARYELFYVSLDTAIWVASYRTTVDAFVNDKPRLWAPAGTVLERGRSFDLHPDGKRFAILKGTALPEHTHLSLMTDAFTEVRRLLQAAAR